MESLLVRLEFNFCGAIGKGELTKVRHQLQAKYVEGLGLLRLLHSVSVLCIR